MVGLIIGLDDDQNVHDISEMVLGNNDYSYVGCLDWAEFNSVYNQNRADCTALLIDVNLPVIGGGQMVDIIRRNHKPEHPIILYSSEDESKLRQMAKQYGADGYIQKGLPENLVRGLRRLIT